VARITQFQAVMGAWVAFFVVLFTLPLFFFAATQVPVSKMLGVVKLLIL
jgi:hypothetical protein